MSTSQSYATNNGRANSLVALPATNQALSLDSPPTVRQYFEKVRELLKSGIRFPVQLDEVWPLVYNKKSDAVEALQRDFMLELDYSFLRKSPQKSKGRPTEVYELSVPCMEWLIARKVREVFEVYREVFHRVADMAEQAAQQTTLVAIVNDLTAKMINLEDKLDRLAKSRQRYYKAFVVEKQKASAQKEHDAKFEERSGLFDLFARYTKVHNYQSGEAILGHILNAAARNYNWDLTRTVRLPGEHYFDLAIRMGKGHIINEIISCHLHESSKLK